MNDLVRQLFESQVYPSFADRYNLNKKNNGEYASDALEDHWNTFQEGFKLAVMVTCTTPSLPIIRLLIKRGI